MPNDSKAVVQAFVEEVQNKGNAVIHDQVAEGDTT